MRRAAQRIATALLALGLAAAGPGACSSSTLRQVCKTDGDCAAHQKCFRGACGCADDQACPSGQICGRNGHCHTDVGCVDNGDCPANLVCDTTTHNCVESGQCTSDLQCPLGQVCDSLGGNPSYTCRNGCRDSSDCPQSPKHQTCGTADGTICVCPPGADRATCPQGGDGGAVSSCTCQENLCDSTDRCPYGDRCLPDPQGKPVCEFATDPAHPYCAGCTFGPADPSCGGGANFCLAEPAYPGAPNYCGVDCSGGEECPSGYSCQYVRLLTHGLCTSDRDCGSASQVTCTGDADCPGARCDTNLGRCAGLCHIDEGEKTGYCTCVVDQDCPKESCEATQRRCGLSRKPCDPADPSSCVNRIFCMNVKGLNACVLGKNCKPLDGLTCDDLPRGQ